MYVYTLYLEVVRDLEKSFKPPFQDGFYYIIQLLYYLLIEHFFLLFYFIFFRNKYIALFF